MGGNYYFILCMILLAISCLLRIFSDYCLAAWPKNDYNLEY